MEAARFGNAEACRRLIELRADLSLQNIQGHSAFHVSRAPMPEYLSMCEAGASDLNWESYKRAVEHGRQEAVRALASSSRALDSTIHLSLPPH
eukprot:TRINITY_DN95795_c0_g1_i1.p1 TRINITY_DN95795_c0_g1~~TRINITY_DN95795_c0_g1_i1.p1  ORF type:complete len:104 (+),score=13.59 TRINITY_DN95795_c0_g1_i1:35-313(+)